MGVKVPGTLRAHTQSGLSQAEGRLEDVCNFARRLIHAGERVRFSVGIAGSEENPTPIFLVRWGRRVRKPMSLFSLGRAEDSAHEVALARMGCPAGA